MIENVQRQRETLNDAAETNKQAWGRRNMFNPTEFKGKGSKVLLGCKVFCSAGVILQGQEKQHFAFIEKNKTHMHINVMWWKASPRSVCLKSGFTPVFRVAMKLTVEWHRQKYYLLKILNIFTLAWQLFPQAASQCDWTIWKKRLRLSLHYLGKLRTPVEVKAGKKQTLTCVLAEKAGKTYV